MRGYAALVLAAGLGSRFAASGGREPSKLVASFQGSSVVRHVVRAALVSRADPVVVVTGHAADAVEEALDGLAVSFAFNAAFERGLAGSLKVGVAALPAEAGGAVVLLGDMPLVTAGLIDRLLDAAEREPAVDAVIPALEGRRGNPVVLARSLFKAVGHLDGDAGARRLLRTPGIRVREIEPGDANILLDIDQPSDLGQSDGLHRSA